MSIYLDYNAGAPLRPEVRRALGDYLAGNYGNPSSVHRSGQYARRALERAREAVARLLGAQPRQIVFTSGGTESNNAAIAAALEALAPRRRVVSSSIEHSSILSPLKKIAAQGCQAVMLNPDRDGCVEADRIADALGDATALVTLGLANSEVGTVQNVLGLAGRVQAAGACFHLDAAQAIGRLPVSVAQLGCDLMTLSGHKLGTPAGIGALYVKDAERFRASMLGGPQEGGLRAGTQNVSAAVALGAAAEAIRVNLDYESAHMRSLSARLLELLNDAIPNLVLNGDGAQRLPNTLNLTFPGVDGESMLIALDLDGVEASMGSACAAGAVEPSHVLLAMGRSAAQARSSLRFSLGWATTREEVESAAAIIKRVWQRVSVAEPVRPVAAAASSEARS